MTNIKLQHSIFVVSLDQFLSNSILHKYSTNWKTFASFYVTHFTAFVFHAMMVKVNYLPTICVHLLSSHSNIPTVPKFVNKFNHMSSCLPMNEKRILMNKQRLAVIHTITLKYDRVGHFILLLLLCRNVAVLVINLRVSYNFALLLPSSIYQRNKKSQLYKLFVSYHAYLMMK